MSESMRTGPDPDLSAAGKRELLARLLRERAGQAHAAPPRPPQAAAGALPGIVPNPAAWGEPFPLNDLQQAYLFGRTGEVELGHNSIHIYAEFESRDLDLERLGRAFERLVERHGMLRVLLSADGTQRIQAQVPPYRIASSDLRAEALATAEAEVLRQRERMSHQIFPVGEWPMFEIRACLLPDGRTTVHFSMDMIGVDAPSFLLLFKDWGRLYHAPEVALPPLELSYRDYALAESALRHSEVARPSREYWLGRLADLPPAPQVPLARDPATLARPCFRRRSGRLEAASWRRLQERGRQAGLTPASVVGAAFAEVLGAWSESPRFCLNAVVVKRLALHPQVQDILGVFSDLVLLEVDARAAATFEQRALRIQERLWTDLDHQHFGGVRLLRELARRQGGLKARMPVVFTAILLDFSLLEWLGDIKLFLTQTPQVWLDHQIMEQAGALAFHWDAVEELFPPGLLDDMFEAYSGLLARLADGEEGWSAPGRLPLPAAQEAVRAAVNGTAAPLPEGLLQTGFCAQAARHPERTAVSAAGRSLTYGELDRLSDALGLRLREGGARPNELVAVVMEKGWEQVVAVLAILKAGAAYLPIGPALPAERLGYLLDNGRVGLAVTQPALDRRLAWPPGVARLAVGREDGAGAPSPLAPVQGPDDLAYVIYTSGSTGLPKGVVISHRAALNTIADINRRFAVGPEDRVLALSALSFDLSVYDLFGTLAAGGTVVLPEAGSERDPERWARLLEREGVTVWNSVPALMEMLAEYGECRGLHLKLRLMLLSGDWIPVRLPERIRRLAPGAEIVSLGGATEAAIWSIAYPIAAVDPAWESIPYGRPLTNQSFHVLDEDLAPRPDWVAGHLYIGGAGLAQGYWRDGEKTATSFLAHPVTGERLYRTGDLGRYLPGGDIEFLGRKDTQVKVQGHRIELGEIEAALLRHPEVREAVVAAPTGPGGQRRLAAYVVARDGAPAADELRAFLRSSLPEAVIPATFTRLDALPLTANGKVDRKALPAPWQAAPADGAGTGTETPTTLLERVARLAAEVLGMGSVAPDADLLELGASSIDMVRIANQLERELGFRPAVGEIFLLSTVRSLAAACERHLRQAGAAASAMSATSAWAPERVLLDPRERALFKSRQPGLRPLADRPGLALGCRASEAELQELYARRSSRRTFRRAPIPRERFEELLGCLRQIPLAGQPKYLYPSAGGLYPVQTYLWVRPGRVEGVAGGAWYYHPAAHRLVLLDPELVVDRGLHTAVNRELFEESAFSLFLVAELRAIAPLYGEYATAFATVEAGYMGQLLMTSAPEGIGLCPIGDLRFDPLRAAFDLGESHALLHSLVGGWSDDTRRREEPVTWGEPAGGEAAIPRAPRNGPLPLSFAQRRIWFLDQLDPGNHLYNRATAIRLAGPLDAAVLERALGAILARHEMLRTTFGAVDGEPFQVVHPEPLLRLAHEDLRPLAAAERDDLLRQLAHAEARTRFDLGTGPLLSFRLVRTEEREHVLLTTVHHIAGDGWSLGVFLRELAALYEAFAAGRPSPLLELAVQYADYAVWQRQQARGEAFAAQLDYWRGQLAGAPPLLALPADRPRPAVQSHRGGQWRQVLPPALVERLKELSRGEGATLFMVLLAGLEALLHRRTGQQDVVLGSPIANRNRAELEPLIGFFINALVLRTDLSRNPTFRELLDRVRATVLGAYAHQDVPFEALVEELRIERSLGHAPLFQVWFVFQNAPMPAERFCGLTVDHQEIEDGTAKFDLQVFLEPKGEGIEVTWSYSLDLFEEASVARLGGEFAVLLADAAERPAARLDELALLAEEERERHAMERTQRQELEVNSLRFARRRAVDLADVDIVRIGTLAPGAELPLVITPAGADVDIIDWARNERAILEQRLLEHGAILFRGFRIASVVEFERLALALCPELFGEYGDLPREQVGGKVYSSTPYPPDKAILFHNESSQMDRWPLKQWFYCVTPAAAGGETPLADCRKIYGLLRLEVRERFAREGVRYIRNFTPGLDVPWQEFFHTTDRAEVEAACRRAGMELEWRGADGLRTSKRAPAVAVHPKTGETIFFNQIQAHHVSCLDPATRASLLALFGEEGLPRNVYYGDGSAIEDEVMAEVRGAYAQVAVEFPWQQHDVLLVDNMLVAHSRNPYQGARKIAVVMGEMVGDARREGA